MCDRINQVFLRVLKSVGRIALLSISMIIVVQFVLIWIYSYECLYWVDEEGYYDGCSCNFRVDGLDVGGMRFYLEDSYRKEEGYELTVLLDLNKAHMRTKFMDAFVEVRGKSVPIQLLEEDFQGVHRHYKFAQTTNLRPLHPGDKLEIVVRIHVEDGENGKVGEICGRARLVAKKVRLIAWPT